MKKSTYNFLKPYMGCTGPRKTIIITISIIYFISVILSQINFIFIFLLIPFLLIYVIWCITLMNFDAYYIDKLAKF